MSELFQIYLPIAETRIDILILVAIGLGIGLLAGMFGLGGGLICVPILLAVGVDPNVAVASATNQMTATSFSGYLAYARRNRVDYKLGLLMVVGGLAGAIGGIILFDKLNDTGQLDFVIPICFVLLLSIVGISTAKDTISSLYYKFKKIKKPQLRKIVWFEGISLPLRITLSSTKEQISIFSPIVIGFIGGLAVSLLGIGGSIILIPAMLYIFRLPEAYTAGTAHFQIIFTTILATVLHSLTNHNIDLVLSTILIIGTVFGAQIGVKLGTSFHPDNFRLLLALIILMLCIKVLYGLVAIPDNLYAVELLR